MNKEKLEVKAAAAWTVLAAGVLLAGSALATPINMGGEEANLQEVLDGITCQADTPGCVLGGPSSVNVGTDQFGHDQRWSLGGTGGAFSQIVIEIAGYAEYNRFGIYDVFAPLNRVEMFAGTAGAGAQALLSMDETGRIYRNFADTGAVFSGNLFGFYLDTPDGMWFSEVGLNSDESDHLIAFSGTGDRIKLPNSMPGLWTESEFVLAWEDLHQSHWDYDYNDFVVMVESITGVPEPATLALMGLGLLGLAFSRRARRQKAAS